MYFLQTLVSKNFLLAASLGLVTNTLLIVLIVKRTTKEMRAYSRILLQTCISDVCTLLQLALVQPIHFVDKDENITIFLGLLRILKYPWALFVFYFVIFFFELAAYQFSVQFYYRYLHLTKNQKLSLCKYTLLLLSFPALSIASIIVTQLFTIYFNNQRAPYTINICDPAYQEWLKPVSNDGGNNETIYVVYRSSNVIERVVVVLNHLILLIVSLTVVLVCALKTQSYVRENLIRPSQASILEVSQQLHRVLCIQASLPFLYFGFSIVAISIYMVGHLIDDPKRSALVINTALLPLVWVSAVNPCVTIYIVKAYRKALLRYLPRAWMNRKHQNLVSVEDHSEKSNNIQLRVTVNEQQKLEQYN